MKKLFTAIMLLLCINGYGQDLSVIFATFIDINQGDTIPCEVYIYKQTEDESYLLKTKAFKNRTMFSLSEGTYILCYISNDKIIHKDILYLDENPSVIVNNLLSKPIPLKDFDFSNVIHLTPGAVDLATRKYIYIEF